MNDKVISFPGADPIPENPIQLERNDRYCSHDAVSLDEHQRVVNCGKCGAVLDPFNFLRDNARTLQAAWGNYRMVKAKATEVMERIDILERERKRLSAPEVESVMRAGGYALLEAARCNARHGQYQFTAPGEIAMDEALDMYEQILRLSTPNQMHAAAEEGARRMRQGEVLTA